MAGRPAAGAPWFDRTTCVLLEALAAAEVAVPGAAFSGGRATTGPWTGRLAIAGGRMMTAGAGRGCGITTRRGGAAGAPETGPEKAGVAARGETETTAPAAGDGEDAAAPGAVCCASDACAAGAGATTGVAAAVTTTGVAAVTGAVPAGRAPGFTGCAAPPSCDEAGDLCASAPGTVTTGRAVVAAGVTMAAGAGAFAGGRAEAGATVTAARGGGMLRAAASACLRSKIAFSASPGLETWDRLKPCRASAAAGREDDEEERLPRLM